MTQFPRLSQRIGVESGKRIDHEGNISNSAISIGGEHIQGGFFSLGDEPRLIPLDFFETHQKGQIKPGDTLYVKDGATIGKSMFVENLPYPQMMVNEHVFILRPQGIFPKFLSYLVQSKNSIDAVWSNVMSAAQPGIGKGFAKRIPVLIDCEATQNEIANFLDQETACIDQLIEKKQRLVEVLGEKLAAILERSTTPKKKRLEEMIPFRWVCRIVEGQVNPTVPEWIDKPLIAPNHILSGNGRILKIETAREQGAVSGKYAFPAGTVLYSKIRPALAKACIAPKNGMCSADMYPILPDNRLSHKFLLMQLLSRRFTNWATLESMRVAMPKINRETIGNYRLWVPSKEVQLKQYLKYRNKSNSIDSISVHINDSIQRLQELRSALITAATTGQINVTTWSKRGETDRRLDEPEQAGEHG